MSGCHALVSGIALAAVVTIGSSCGSPMDPFRSGSAQAFVTGVVTGPGGTPLPGTAVHIVCGGGGPAISVSTDATGQYLANLSTGSDPFDGGSGLLRCRFTEPAAPNVRVQVDTSLGFARGPVMLARQFVDLHES